MLIFKNILILLLILILFKIDFHSNKFIESILVLIIIIYRVKCLNVIF